MNKKHFGIKTFCKKWQVGILSCRLYLITDSLRYLQSAQRGTCFHFHWSYFVFLSIFAKLQRQHLQFRTGAKGAGVDIFRINIPETFLVLMRTLSKNRQFRQFCTAHCLFFFVPLIPVSNQHYLPTIFQRWSNVILSRHPTLSQRIKSCKTIYCFNVGQTLIWHFAQQ